MKNTWKYIRIALILTSVCLVCALGVAGVNFVTAPVIEANENAAKLAGYKKIFPELDDSNSEIISSGFKSDLVKEKVVVKNSEGLHLGYAFNTKGKNSYGPISLIVGFDTEGKLLQLVATENGQTGGRADMINEYLNSFTAGMTPNEINNKPVYAGATFGSKLVKQLINAALAELGIKTPLQEELEAIFGEGVDMNKTVEDAAFIYAKEILEGYTVKNSSNAVLGYYYKTNVLGNKANVALDANYTLKTQDVSELVAKVVTNEVKGVADEALILELSFGLNLKTEAMEIKDTDKVKKGSKVLDSETNALLGYLIAAEGATKVPGTDAAKISLLITLNADASYAGAYITENGQTAGRDEKVSEFVASLDSGMSGTDVLLANPVASATMGANLVKDLVAEAIKAVTGTKPELPDEGYAAYYKQAFKDVDLSKSQKIESFKDVTKQIKEGMILNDASGKLLGYGYVIKSDENKHQGTFDLFVAVNADNTLNKVTVLKNAQTGGVADKLVGYEDKFTNGMASADIDSIAPVTGATVGSDQFKALIKIALAEQSGGIVEFYVKAFEGIDMNKSVLAGPFDIKQAQVEDKITAKDSKGNIIGYGVIVNLSNVYSKNKMLVTFDKDKKFAKLIDISNTHASMDKIDVSGLVGKGSIEEINSYFNKLIEAGSSFSNDMARLGIMIAYEEIAGNPYGQNLTIQGEDLLKSIYPNMVAAHSHLVEGYTAKNTGVEQKIYIGGTNKNYQDKVQIGTAYLITVENTHDKLRVLVGLDEKNNFVSARVLEATADDVIDYSLFQSRMQQYMNAYLTTEFKAGMTATDINRVKNYHAAQYASQILKHALCIALNEASKASALPMINSYNNTEAYYDAIVGIDFGKTVSNMENVDTAKYPEILDAIIAKDANGNFLANAYIVYINDVYSHNYVMVLLDNSNNLLGVYDVQNDHGALENYISMFTPGHKPLTEEAIKNLDGYLNSDSSFTVEVIRRAVLKAMEVNAKSANQDLAREDAARTIFPLMVNLRSFDLNIVNTPSKVVFAKEINGVKNYQNGQLIGYVYELKVNDNLTITVSASVAGNLFVKDNQVNYVINSNNTGTSNKDILAYLAKFGTEVDSEAKIDAVKDEFALAADIKRALKDALKEAKEHTSKTPYDALIKNLFKDYSYENSKHLDAKAEKDPYTFFNKEIFYAEEVHNKNGELLGYAYVMTISNPYSKNTVVVAVDALGAFVGYKDYINNHASIDAVDYSDLVGLKDLALISAKFDAKYQGGSTYTIDMAKYAVRVAMNEYLKGISKSVDYEVLAKRIFPYMVSFHSSEIDKATFKNESVILGINVKGTKNYQNNQDLGKLYLIKQSYKEGYLTIMVGIDTNGKFVGAHVVDSDITNNMTGTGNLASKAQAYLEHFSGYTKDQINSVPNQDGELFIDFLVKNIIITAFAEFEGSAAANLFDIEEATYAEAFNKAFGVYDESKSEVVKEGFINSNIIRALTAVKRNGEVLGTAYIMFVDNVYGRNYVVVILDNEGNFKGFVDIQNDHAELAGNDKLFVSGMTEAQIEGIVHAGGSFTTELLKLAVLTAMSENKKEAMPRVEYEVALKNLYPYIVLQRSHSINVLPNTKVKAGYFVVGVSWYTTNKELGYAYLLNVNDKLDIMVSVNLENKLFLGPDYFITSTLGKMPLGYTIVRNETGVKDADINAYLAKFGTLVDSEAKIDAVKDEFTLAADIKRALKDCLAEASRHKLLSTNDAFIRAEFKDLDDVNSVKNDIKQAEVRSSVTVKNSAGELLGYALIITLKNTWCDDDNRFKPTDEIRPNVMLVTLDANKNYLNLVDIENHHANMNDQAKKYAGLKTMEEIDTKLSELQLAGHGTMSAEMAGLGIKIAMTEISGLNNEIRYEAMAKQMFIGMITAHSEKIAANGEIEAGYIVKGVEGFGPVATLGKVLVLKNANAHILVGVRDSKVISVYDLNNKEVILTDYSNKGKAEVEAMADSAVKTLVLKAIAEGGNK